METETRAAGIVLVNVRRSATPANPESRRREAAAGDWPVRAHIAEDAATCRYLAAISRDRLVGLWLITGQSRTPAGRLRFTLEPCPDGKELVGTRVPASWRWARGQSWPIKTSEDDPLAELNPIGSATIGDFQVQLAANGRALTITAPRGGSVIVETARD